jgi:WD40 repeat protein
MKRAVLAVLVVGALLPASAQAAFPGANGKIAFQRGDDIWTMNPDGSNQVNLTNSAAAERDPAWSPNGTQIAFSSNGIHVMNADGSGETPVANTSGGSDPTWSPDGTQIAYVNFGAGAVYKINLDGTGNALVFAGDGPADPEWSPDGTRIAVTDDGPPPDCIEDVYVVDADGTNPDNLTCGLDQAEFNTYANWSPDAQRIAFDHDGTCTPGPNCRPFGITTLKPDKTDPQFVYSGNEPAWSPDGNKFAFSTVVSSNTSHVWTVGADGTGAVDHGLGSAPDWQPIPINSYARPKGATPFRASLAIAYEPCSAPNRTHGPPLAFPSCNPPVQTSHYLTVGTADANARPALNEGYLRLDAQPGAPGGPDDADVGIDFFMDDVFTKPGLADYTGELRARVVLQITDKDNTPSPGDPGAATTQGIPLELTVPCVAVADPSEGSACVTSTTADTLVPGTVKEGRRAIWQLGRTEVYDGGADGDAQTPAGDTLFATQGLFVP